MKLFRIYQPHPRTSYGEGVQYICPYLCNKLKPNTTYFTLVYSTNKLRRLRIDEIETKTLIDWEDTYKHTLVPLKDTHELT